MNIDIDTPALLDMLGRATRNEEFSTMPFHIVGYGETVNGIVDFMLSTNDYDMHWIRPIQIICDHDFHIKVDSSQGLMKAIEIYKEDAIQALVLDPDGGKAGEKGELISDEENTMPVTFCDTVLPSFDDLSHEMACSFVRYSSDGTVGFLLPGKNYYIITELKELGNVEELKEIIRFFDKQQAEEVEGELTNMVSSARRGRASTEQTEPDPVEPTEDANVEEVSTETAEEVVEEVAETPDPVEEEEVVATEPAPEPSSKPEPEESSAEPAKRGKRRSNAEVVAKKVADYTEYLDNQGYQVVAKDTNPEDMLRRLDQCVVGLQQHFLAQKEHDEVHAIDPADEDAIRRDERARVVKEMEERMTKVFKQK